MNILKTIWDYLINSNILYGVLLFLALTIYKLFKLYINSKLHKLKSTTLKKIIIKAIKLTDELFDNKSSTYKFESTVAGVNDKIDDLIESKKTNFSDKSLLKKLYHSKELKNLIQEEFYNYKRSIIDLEIVQSTEENTPHLLINEDKE